MEHHLCFKVAHSLDKKAMEKRVFIYFIAQIVSALVIGSFFNLPFASI